MSMKLHKPDDCCASHSGGLAASPRAASMLAHLLTNHALRHGEVIYLAIKPSLWFILLSSMKFIAAALIVTIAANVYDGASAHRSISYWGAALFVIFGRLTWATLQWMGRLYVLTDQRIIRVQGVFTIDVFDCPLRRVARVDVLRSTRERIFRLGTMHITPAEQSLPLAQWQMVRKPDEIHAEIIDAIERNRRFGGMIKAA